MSGGPAVLDLFCGAGGMALGFRGAGARCVGGVDADAAAGETFRTMFSAEGARVFAGADGDVNELPVRNLLDSLPESPAIITGGPPCQGFSKIGRAKHASLLDAQSRVLLGGQADPGRNLLYRYFLAVVHQARPLAFVMENVPGMQSMLGVDHAQRIAREAATLGYTVRYFLLNASWYGVPQRRWRLFFIGIRRDLGALTVPRPPVRRCEGPREPGEFRSIPDDTWFIKGADVPVSSTLAQPVSVHQALADLPRMAGHLAGETPGDSPRSYRRSPRSGFARLMRAWPGLENCGELVDGCWYRANTRDYETFRRMTPGDRYPQALAIANGRFQEALRALGPEAPAPDSDAWRSLEAGIVPPYRNDAFHDKWRKLVLDEPSWTLTAHLGKDTYSHIHYDSRQARAISVREAGRLQSFPDAWNFQGNHGQRFRQVGNAVPPLLAWAIAESVLGQLGELGALGGFSPRVHPARDGLFD